MRFHIGFSKRITWKWIIGALGVLAAFFFGNHVALAATAMSADATKVSAVSPQQETYISGIQQSVATGNFINVTNGTPYCTTWSSQRYCAFQINADPKAIGYRDSIQNARLRWYYSKTSMAKCSNGQYITYEFKLFLRNITSGSLPQLWETSGLYSRIFARTASTNYTCSISTDSHVLTATCTMPNPTDEVQLIIEGFTIPYGSVIDNGYYNVGAMPVSYDCSNDSSGVIINNQNQNTQQIINNQNDNTQQIIQSQQDINTSIINSNIDNNTTSHAGTFFNNTTINDHGLSSIVTLPINLLQGILNSQSSCNDFIFFDADDIFGLGSNIITLPSGCILWNRASSTIKTIYWTLLYGGLGYALLTDIWITINHVIDPEKKNDYVMDL